MSAARALAVLLLLAGAGAAADTSHPAMPTRANTVCTLRRTHCASSAGCDWRSLRVDDNGDVVFEEGGTNEYGGGAPRKVASKLDAAALRQLVTAIERSRFFSLRGQYDSGSVAEASVDDHWTTTMLSVHRGGRHETVSWDEEPSYAAKERITTAPQRLVELGVAIEEIVGVDRLSSAR